MTRAGLVMRLFGPPGGGELPRRVQALIEAQEEESERLICWAQLALVGLFALLYLAASRPADAPGKLLAPVPAALLLYAAFTLIRLHLAHLGRLAPSWVIGSIIADTALLLGLIWSFHLQYAQPPAFALKVPTFIYFMVFIALRALRFDHRLVLTAGLAAAGGWVMLVLAALTLSPEGAVTRNFVAYVTGNAILIGAELDKVLAILMATAVLTVAVRRARHTLVTAIREEEAGREVSRFLSDGVAHAISRAETRIEPGHAVERDAAIVMLDIRGFTRLSASLAPAEVVRLLTDFHARIVPIVRANRGVIDKFLGDGVMATFGAVRASGTAAADALRALEAIMTEAEAWRGALLAEGTTAPLEINGAVAAGRVVFATLGSSVRLEYTVIGDAANLAAKLEKHNKVAGTRALAPLATLLMAEAQGYAPARAPARLPGSIVAGTTEPMDLVALAGPRAP